MSKTKKFDCVKMVRDIRDEFYEKHKDKSIDEILDIIREEAQQSPLWKKFKKGQPYSKTNQSNQSLKVADKND
ncbi:hypothetical protein H8E88_09060 [candidate division KSB1 bacterium]|nr:hypothetical protein [candidate division KSB1 bacterium]MBL7094073.1 hypothetical protein [candidate division KSB1 bacterium]